MQIVTSRQIYTFYLLNALNLNLFGHMTVKQSLHYCGVIHASEHFLFKLNSTSIF